MIRRLVPPHSAIKSMLAHVERCTAAYGGAFHIGVPSVAEELLRKKWIEKVSDPTDSNVSIYRISPSGTDYLRSLRNAGTI